MWVKEDGAIRGLFADIGLNAELELLPTLNDESDRGLVLTRAPIGYFGCCGTLDNNTLVGTG